MELLIRGHNMNLTKANKDYALNKIQHTERFFSNKSARSKINVERLPNQFKVEITIETPGMRLRASEKNENFYAAVDGVIDKLEKQIRKQKTKTLKKQKHSATNRKAEHSTEEPLETLLSKELIKDTKVDEDILQTEDGNQKVVVVRDKEFLKPMCLEEAVLQLTNSENDFFIFQSESSNTNILYKRHDGSYGLIRTK